MRRLRRNRIVSVVGTSGCGKSSLVRSGLIPSLQSGFMAKAGSSWRVCMLRPGENPIGHMAASLSARDMLGAAGEPSSTNRVLQEVTLRRGALGLIEAVRQARIPPHDNLLVVVDQFEELFRFRRSREIENSREEAVGFVKLLLEATRQNDVPIYVVLTMRSDFLGDCVEFPGLPEAVNAGLYLVPRMTRDELRTAIIGPAAVGGGEIAPRLVTRLLNDMGDDPDQLPVLQHALMRTWDHWEQHRQAGEPIDIADYEAVGTLREALSRHAEEAYEETEREGGLPIAERLFKALTDTFSDQRGVRRPTSVGELAAICEGTEEEVIRIVEVFRRPGRSFLMPPPAIALDSRSIIDLSHESLMRCWTRLIRWAEEERASAGQYMRLSQAAGWYEDGTAGLWRDPELELGLRWKRENRPTAAWAQRYDPSFPRAMDFLDQSEKERNRLQADREKERKRKLRQAWGVATVLGILLVAALYLSYEARQEHARAEENLRQATKAVDAMLSSAGRQQARVWEDVPQMEEFREELLEKAKVFYDRFTKQEPDNDQLRNEVAQAHFRLGDIHRLVRDDQKAEREYQEAIAEFGSLAETDPGDAGYRERLANSYNWLGVAQARTPDTRTDAEHAYDNALRLQKSLVRENPANTQLREEMARTYYNRGIVRSYRGLLLASEADFREAIRLLEPLANNRLDPAPSQELARVYNNLAVLFQRENKPAEAKDFYERAVGVEEGLMERGRARKDPRLREYKEELATYEDNLAYLLQEQGQSALAAQRNGRALDLLKELDDPGPSLAAGLVKAYNLRCQILVESGQPVEMAGEECNRSLAILGQQQAARGFREGPQANELFRNLGYDYQELANRSLKAGSRGEARNALEKLALLLPKISQPDRGKLTKFYRKLQHELADQVTKKE